MNAGQWHQKYCDGNCFALITGASSGIGYQYLRSFAELGCHCIATSDDGQELADAGARVREECGTRVVEVVADLGEAAGVRALLDACDRYEVVALVNNAGIGLKGEFCEHSPELYQRLIHINAVAPTLIARHLIPQMVRGNRGLVLHVASVNACTPIAYNAVYTASKAYLLYYAYAVAYELRGTAIFFQIVLPGTTNTPFHKRQGVVPAKMCLEPDVVVERSMAQIDRSLSVSNRLDRILFPIVAALPLWLRLRIGTRLLKHRLRAIDGLSSAVDGALC